MQRKINKILLAMLLLCPLISMAQIGINGNIQTLTVGISEAITDRNINLEYKLAPFKTVAFVVKLGMIKNTTATFSNRQIKRFEDKNFELYSDVFQSSFATKMSEGVNFNSLYNVGVGATFTSKSTGLSQPLGYYSGFMINVFRGEVLTQYLNKNTDIPGATNLAKQEFFFKVKHTEFIWTYGCMQPVYGNFILDWRMDVGFAFGSMVYDKSYSQPRGTAGEYEKTDFFATAERPTPTVNIVDYALGIRYFAGRQINNNYVNILLMPRVRVGYLF
jgi:hypothetical protein